MCNPFVAGVWCIPREIHKSCVYRLRVQAVLSVSWHFGSESWRISKLACRRFEYEL